MLLDKVLQRIIREGNLSVEYAAGHVRRYGNGTGPSVRIRFHDPRAEFAAGLWPRLKIAEAYVDGRMTIEEGTLSEFLYTTGRNLVSVDQGAIATLVRLLGASVNLVATYNPIGRAQRNVAHHYDLDRAFFTTFLDKDLQYSCAYFRNPDDDLETAQHDKKEYIARKLRLEPGLRVLDIGSGWGGLAIHLAQHHGCSVLGVTLSQEQYAVSRERVADAGLEDLIEIRLLDYRLLSEQFDRIVSVGMFEHLGKAHFDEYFRKLKTLLADDGVALVHTIGRMGTPEPISPWMRRYIFPGAYLPTMSEITGAVEKQWLWVNDFEIWRQHYANTLLHWNRRFQENRDKIARIYDERFCRMWELYLIGCEMSFRIQELCVFQVQLSKRNDIVPLTRDYLYQY